MCLAMYLFTDNSLKETGWTKKNPNFFVKKTINEDEPKTFKWNSENLNVYYLGSSKGCGCGWRTISEYEDEIEIKHKAEDRKQLVDTLKNLDLKKSWIVACWEGEQGCELSPQIKITLEEIGNPEYEFEELRKYIFE